MSMLHRSKFKVQDHKDQMLQPDSYTFTLMKTTIYIKRKNSSLLQVSATISLICFLEVV